MRRDCYRRLCMGLFVSMMVTGTLAAKPIKLAFSAWPGWIPWQVAVEKELFKKNGVDVTFVWYDDYIKSIEDFSAGKVDGNCQTLNDTIMSASNGKKLKAVLVNDNSSGNDQIIVKKEINSVKELKDKYVAAEAGTVDHFLLTVVLADNGLTEKDIRFKNMLTDEAAKSFAEGKLDAVGVFAPFTTAALATGKGKVIASSKDYPGLIPDLLILDDKIVQGQPDAVQAIVKTWFDTLAYIEANPKESLEIMAKRGGVSVAEYKEYETGTRIFTLDENLKAFDKSNKDATSLHVTGKRIAKYLRDGKFISRSVSLKRLLDNQFVAKAVKPRCVTPHNQIIFQSFVNSPKASG